MPAGILKHEHDLEERCAAQVALRLERIYQHLKGHVLVSIRAQRRLARALEQFAEGWLAGKIAAQHERVDEEADEGFNFGPGAVGNGCADANIFLPGVAMQERLKHGQRGHKQGGLFLSRQRLYFWREVRRQSEREVCAPVSLHRRSRPVGRQLQGGQFTAQLLLPIFKLTLKHIAVQPLALPGREVGILQWQVGEQWPFGKLRARVPRRKGLVQRRHFADEDVG